MYIYLHVSIYRFITLLFIYKFISLFIVYVCFSCMNIFISYVCLVTTESRRCHQIQRTGLAHTHESPCSCLGSNPGPLKQCQCSAKPKIQALPPSILFFFFYKFSSFVQETSLLFRIKVRPVRVPQEKLNPWRSI